MDRRRDNTVCEHGSQRRKCPYCELAEAEDDLARVTAERDKAIAEIGKIGRELGKRQAELERLRADAEIGRKWRNDSSLETWFPITAEGIEVGYKLRETLLDALVQILGWRELRDSNDIPIERIEDIARAAIDEARKG